MVQQRRAVRAGLAIALGFALAACSPTTDWPGSGIGGGGGGSSQSGDRTPAPTASSTPAATASEAPRASDPQSCLQGTWLADNAFWLASIRQFGDEIKSVDGQVLVTFDGDGGLTTEYLGWLITAEAEGITVTISREGADTGVYDATDTTLSFQDTSIGSTLSVSGFGSIAPTPASYSEAPYSCDAGALVINTSDGTLQMTRQ